MRQNIITGQWVINAVERGERPNDFKMNSKRTAQANLPEKSQKCPFCVGNESMLAETIMHYPQGSGQWQCRVVRNKYPVVTKQKRGQEKNDGPFVRTPATGEHEVIIESPLHNQDFSLMSSGEIEAVVRTYRSRYSSLFEDDETSCVIIFRNRGPGAGTSLMHPHSQIISLTVLPEYIKTAKRNCKSFYEDNGQCPVCVTAAREKDEQKRVVYSNDGFLVFMPFAAEVPFEMWVVGREHKSEFGAISDDEAGGLAEALSVCTKRLDELLDSPDYNMVVRSFCRATDNSEAYLHWFIQIRPRVTEPAGFEVGSGMIVNPSLPEENAKLFRGDDYA
jgi:UDPglucose--hexose-1-phosphate uridylyltransferase